MKRRRIYVPTLAIIIVAIGVLFFTDLSGLDLLPGLPKLRLQRVTRFSTSSVTLTEVRELYALSTLEYVHRFVFPHDFLPDDTSIQEITRKLRNGPPGADVEEILSTDELLYLRTWNLATDVGLARSDGFDFVVVTVVMAAGFDVSEESFASVGELATDEYVDDDGSTHYRITVPSPHAQILNTIVEDIIPDDYPYPDLAMSADNWRRVTQYVRTQPLDEETLSRILRTAEENGRLFLDQLLRNAGFDDVEFSQE